ncbi:MAG: hypothetical protein JST35_05590 [Armatimonadetes bacterium]|nr:hypothetical protein [Armatimonadota bacterium]
MHRKFITLFSIAALIVGGLAGCKKKDPDEDLSVNKKDAPIIGDNPEAGKDTKKEVPGPVGAAGGATGSPSASPSAEPTPAGK